MCLFRTAGKRSADREPADRESSVLIVERWLGFGLWELLMTEIVVKYILNVLGNIILRRLRIVLGLAIGKASSYGFVCLKYWCYGQQRQQSALCSTGRLK